MKIPSPASRRWYLFLYFAGQSPSEREQKKSERKRERRDGKIYHKAYRIYADHAVYRHNGNILSDAQYPRRSSRAYGEESPGTDKRELL